MGPLEQIVTHPLFALVGFLVGLLGIYLHLRDRKYARLSYATVNFNLVQDYVERIPNLQVAYAGKRVLSITVSRIAFWNSGTDILNGSNIAPGDPLRFEIPEGKILEWQLVEATNPANQISLSLRSNGALHISFDFLNKGDGAIVQILHTGQRVNLLGQVKGVGNPVLQRGATSMERRYREEITTALFFLGCFMLASWVAQLFGQQSPTLLTCIGAFVLASIAYAVYRVFIKPVPRILESLDIFE